MTVRLISRSQFIGEDRTPEEMIVYMARVSNPENQDNMNSASRLIRYLIRHAHWSPFEMVSYVFEIRTCRDISAQIIRHRSFSFQEFSTRYATVPSGESRPPEMRAQAQRNRQSSMEVAELDPALRINLENYMAESRRLYDNLLEAGVARECARRILPLSTTTTLYMQGSLRSWIHYIQIRATSETQKEHREIAVAIKNILCEECPNVARALEWTT